MLSSSPLQHADILERLKEVAIGKVPIDVARLSPDARLSDIGFDSFSLIEFIFLAEEEFDVSIPIEGLSVTTVGDVLNAISRLIGAPQRR